MLLQLSISNYALIGQLDFIPGRGLNMITGETGAGKSIMIGALSLLLGERADVQVLRDKEKKCVVEGTFDISGYTLEGFFEQENLDYESRTIIRREISPNAKSRAFINDTPVNLNQLKSLMEHLIDIHSQHETIELNSGAYQLDIIDACASLIKETEPWRKEYTQYKAKQRELENLKEQERRMQSDHDYHSYLFNELEAVSLKAGEQESMEAEIEMLRHADEILVSLNKAVLLLDGEGQNMTGACHELKTLLNQAKKHLPSLEKLSERSDALLVEVKDILFEIENSVHDIKVDPERAEVLEGKLDMLYRLEQKHNVKTTEELIIVKESLEKKLLSVTDIRDTIDALEKELLKQLETLKQAAARISDKRKKSIPVLEKSVIKMLSELGMPDGLLKAEHTTSDVLTHNGFDQIRFLFTANKGSEAREIAKVASGGELSRLMLSLKSLMAKQKQLPSIIFDEIDQGVSGEIAGKIGGILERMSENMQVICITHLPQIAAKGEKHFKVYKETSGKVTQTQLSELNKTERVNELAAMLSSEELTPAAVANAKELLKK
ncbi:MAG: DNA repair protein RecN [Bacteroidota bacterium]